MKRTLSLILALAMILGCFTTVSFAETVGNGTSGAPYEDEAQFKLSTSNALVPGGKTTVKADTYNYYKSNAAYKDYVEVYNWTFTDTNGVTASANPDGAGKNTIELTATAEATGTHTVECTVTVTAKATADNTPVEIYYKDTIPVTVGNSVGNTDITLVNGQIGTYTGAQLVANAAAAIKAATGATTTPTVTAMTITPSTAGGGITFAGSAAGTTDMAATVLTVNGSTTVLWAKTTAGTIGSRVLNYSATSGGATYTGTLTFKSTYDTAITVSQAAPFYNEEFDLDPISGIYKLGFASAVSVAGADASYTDWQIAPGTTTKTYTGYTSANVAKQVTVNFTYPSYDLISYVDDGKTPFSSDHIESFADSVFAEQLNYSNSRYYSGYLEKVAIHNVSAANQYTLYLGNSKLTTAAITPAQLDTVTMDVLKAGTYYIDFTAYYKYANTSSSSYTSTSYTGRIIVYAGNTGDLSYEVAYGDTVNFRTLDFQALYRKLAGNSKALTYVEIDALPLAGDLYKANRMTNAYAVSVDDKFYVNPTAGQNDLDALLYWASTSYTSEYSVYIPVTMYGTGGFKSAVVEIVVNDGDIPFTDIPKTHTFYEYIRYVYNHDIMNGKSAYRFDASSSITRAQLVTTLYRMAGSPTTYNSRTLPFTDTKTLSTEFSNAVKWAYYNKIVGGTSATTFAPNAAITRQAMVKILYGYAKAYGMSTGVEYNNHIGYYTDGGSVSTSMKDAMNWALDYGLLSGNNSKLNPRGSTTRGAAAKILANFHEDFIG